MKKIFIVVLMLVILGKQNPYAQTWAIALHGGAGNMMPEQFTKEQLDEYQRELSNALQVGINILKGGGKSLDAVEQVVRYLEDCPLFNAGKGSVYTHEGRIELDAAIMDGNTLGAGAVASVRDVKNPISLARKVMEASPHVLLVGSGASEFARLQGVEMADSSYFFTSKRWEEIQRVLSREKMGTVGCVALDIHGNLAAATSTGGMTNKRWGRVGDAPIIGAGTYANNATCAVSATGHGEFFIRNTVAHDISALMEYQNLSLNAAVEKVIMLKLAKAGGRGGVIAVDRKGNVSMMMNTSAMFRAHANSNGVLSFAIF